MFYYDWDNDKEFSIIEGKILKEVSVKEAEHIDFFFEDGSKYRMFHQQDCCETVTIEDIDGDLERLVGQEILLAEEATNRELPHQPNEYDYTPDSYTWTFYKIRTNLDSITIRWYGESNGFYSEEVTFAEYPKED